MESYMLFRKRFQKLHEKFPWNLVDSGKGSTTESLLVGLVGKKFGVSESLPFLIKTCDVKNKNGKYLQSSNHSLVEQYFDLTINY